MNSGDRHEQKDGIDAVIATALADLAANAPAAGILSRLRAAASDIGSLSPRHARLLRARAIAANRLGFADEALGDLLEARRLLEQAPLDRDELVEVLRTTAVIHSWRGEIREAALSLLQAVAAAAENPANLALVLAEAARLELENGRPIHAKRLLEHALKLAPQDFPARERQRMNVNLVQALRAAGQVAEAQSTIDAIAPLIPLSNSRLHLLIAIESMRIALVRKDFAGAERRLILAQSFASCDQLSFDRTEIRDAEAELAIAQGDMARAERLLREVVVRCASAEDDLAPREVVARLRRAETLDALGRTHEADRELAAGLRRAVARGLFGHADVLRTRIATRGGSERAWFSGEEPAQVGHQSTLRFVRQRPLGSGGYGTVWRAYDLELGTEVAVKSFRVEGLYDVRALDRLIKSAHNEIAALSRIEHPGVVRVYGLLSKREGGASTVSELQIIEELVEGSSLRAAMGTPIIRSRALDLLARLAFSLAAVHASGVVHRDLKPENVILRNNSSPVLVDFGIAIVGSTGRPAQRAGTRTYMAPEQARGRRVDARADLYALGVVAHELLLSSLPPPPSQNFLAALSLQPQGGTRGRLLAAGIEFDVAELVARLLAPHPRQRPGSAAAVGQAFSKAAERHHATA